MVGVIVGRSKTGDPARGGRAGERKSDRVRDENEQHYQRLNEAITAIRDPRERLIVAAATSGNELRFSHVQPLCPEGVPMTPEFSRQLGVWIASAAKGRLEPDTRYTIKARRKRMLRRGAHRRGRRPERLGVRRRSSRPRIRPGNRSRRGGSAHSPRDVRRALCLHGHAERGPAAKAARCWRPASLVPARRFVGRRRRGPTLRGWTHRSARAQQASGSSRLATTAASKRTRVPSDASAERSAATPEPAANAGLSEVARPGLEPGTPRFSVVCSTN